LSAEILESFLKQNLPDVYIHCIGSPTVFFAQKNPHLDFENTIVSLSIALESIRKFSSKTLFVLVSSAAVYGGGDGPLAEESICKPLSVYGSNKRIAELLLLEYSEQFNLSTLILRPFSVYGDELKKQVIYDLYKKLNTPSIQHLVIDGMGSELRDFIHISDIAAGIDHLVNNRITGVVNLGTGKSTSLSDLTLILGGLVNPTNSISFSGVSSPLNPQMLVADTHYAKSLGIEIEVDLINGLDSFVNHMKRMR